ncbi:DUF1127 domain-containing protein [Falsiruegeria mediterranea]|uniref:YjiS-like domain-containing protein n=1 Tax=Falsiruegeria mediterranea M17 TaxID=1200281 RepID=A0A2R8CG74_9RHOB|nr:DUF1127 domain-containing protein [Falsiruegeria mediterranea]SPJ31258.1 hypothetical protein TRM7615_04801 [Falsiruegeria mediterranea M17]
MAHVATHEGFGHSLATRIRAAFESMKQARVLRGEYSRTVNELSGLTDRELHDFGFSRYEIHNIANRHVYGDQFRHL